jgi:conjugative transfer signal peptidase TraF
MRWLPRLGTGVLLAAGVAAIEGSGVRLNLSASMPIGLYLARDVRGTRIALSRGTIVAVCLPDRLATWGRSRGYLMRGRCPDGSAPVGKPVFAIAGDTVSVKPDGLARNGRFIPRTVALDRDRAGLPLTRLGCGDYLVRPDQLWLVSTHVPESWDSRYFGPVPTANVIALLRPVWTNNRGE